MTHRPVAAVVALALLLPAGSVAAAGGGDPVFPALGDAGYDARHYAISLSWSEDGSIQATTTMRAKAKRELSRITLDLAGLEVTAVAVNDEPAASTRDGNELRVSPAAALPAGATFTTQVTYSGQPRTLRDAHGTPEGWLRKPVGAIVLAEPRGAMTWFPSNNLPSDKATYDLAVEVPSAYQAVSNGRNTAVVDHGTRSTWHWSVSEPMATYLATVAIGRYARHTRTVDGIRYDSFVADGLPDNATPLRQLPAVVRFLERRFGRYPFRDAGIVVDDVSVSYALELQNRPFFPGYAKTRVLVHELAHQWYGDSVTPRRWNDIWLNEGFATYAEWLWSANHGGPSVRTAYRAAFRATARWWPAPTKVTSRTLFDDAVYTRGAMTLQALRERVGSAAFFRILKRWAEEHRHRGGTTYAFKRLAERVSGRQLDGLFRDWLHTARKPHGYLR